MLTRFLSLLLLPLFTAYLTPGDYGVLALLAVLGFVAHPVFALGLGAGIGPCYFEGNNQRRKRATIWTAFVLLLASAVVLATVTEVWAEHLSGLVFQTERYHLLVTLSLWTTALNILSLPFSLRLQFEERAALYVTLTAIAAVITIGLGVFMVVVRGSGMYGIILSQLIGQAVHLILFIVLAAPGMKFIFDKKLCRELLGLGLPLVPSFVFLFILLHGNRAILERLRGLDAVGIYSVGFNLGLVMVLLVSAFTAAWFPYFLSFMERQKDASVIFGRIFTYYVYGFGSLCLLFFVFARPIVMVMTQPAFHEAYRVVGLSATAQFFIGLFSLLLPGVYFTKELKFVSLVQGAAVIIAVPMNLLLISWLGFFGAGIALALGYFSMAIIQYAWNKRRSNYLEIVYEVPLLLRFAVVFVVIAAVYLLERNWSLYAECVLALTACLVLAAANYRMLNSQERDFIIGRLARGK